MCIPCDQENKIVNCMRNVRKRNRSCSHCGLLWKGYLMHDVVWILYEKDLQSYKAQSPLHRELFYILVLFLNSHLQHGDINVVYFALNFTDTWDLYSILGAKKRGPPPSNQGQRFHMVIAIQSPPPPSPCCSLPYPSGLIPLQCHTFFFWNTATGCNRTPLNVMIDFSNLHQ